MNRCSSASACMSAMSWSTASNLLGDGVNIAARLEALAEPGAICVSAVVRDHIGNKLPLAFDDLGDKQVKNIAQAIRVYRVQTGNAGGTTGHSSARPT